MARKICIHCGGAFEAGDAKTRLCSDYCRREARLERERLRRLQKARGLPLLETYNKRTKEEKIKFLRRVLNGDGETVTEWRGQPRIGRSRF